MLLDPAGTMGRLIGERSPWLMLAVFAVLLQICTFVKADVTQFLWIDENRCQFSVYDISTTLSYRVIWKGKQLPPLCRLGFRVSNVNYYQICAAVSEYKVKDCTFSIQYYHGISTKPNKNYTCSSTPERYCVNSTRYFYLDFNALNKSSSSVTIDMTAKARSNSSKSTSAMMEVLVGGFASLLFVGFSCFVFGAKSRNPCSCLKTLFGKCDVCEPCMVRMESCGNESSSEDGQCSNSRCCILIGSVTAGSREQGQGQATDNGATTDQPELDQPPPYNSITREDSNDPSSDIPPPPIWIQLTPPPYEAPPPAYEEIIHNPDK